MEDQFGLCDLVRDYFENLFQEQQSFYQPVIDAVIPVISEGDNQCLLDPFTEAEFKAAIFHMHPDKSPRPDGLNPAFYQHFWELYGKDIFLACCYWLEVGNFPLSLNDTNIVLIPKIDNPTSMRDMRPISLCNVLYKILAKVLTNRLKKVLSKCISEERSAFVEGRSILDNVLTAFEIIHHMKYKTKGAKGEVALKIDINKAYDRVDWGFL